MKMEIMDTTLRDGEQTSGVSFNEQEKLSIARLLLEEVKVDRIEMASARVSNGEFRAVQRVTSWAKEKGFLSRIEVLGFVDSNKSVDWIIQAGGQVLNLLTKGSLKHVSGQLKKTPEDHVADIKETVAYATQKGLAVNVYLEDWSNGMLDSPEYVFFLLDALKEQPIKRVMLPDTLGILTPGQVYELILAMLERYPSLHFDFHAHNDYDLAVANVLQAVRAGIHGVHTTVNGLGERAGNAPLSSVVGVVADHSKVSCSVNESKLNLVSKLVETFSGIRIPSNKPIVGEYVFTQCSGVHADGDKKDNLYFNDLLPERFGRIRQYALGKTSGKANIAKNLEELGITLDQKALQQVTAKIIELGDRKETVTVEDLPYIISDVLRNDSTHQNIKIQNYVLSHAMGLHPTASISIEIDDRVYEESASGDGQYDAFMNALRKIYQRLNKPFPALVDYAVTIPPGGKTDALVETVITWNLGKEFKTRGLEPDQTAAAIQATLKMLNLIESDALR